MPNLDIAVQPPSRAQVSTMLCPPPVARLTFKGAMPGYYFFAMALLTTRNGDIVEGGLLGTTTVSGLDLTAASGSSRNTIYFTFNELAISLEGAFKIRIDVYKVPYENPDGCTFHAQERTSHVTVVNEPVPAGSAGKSYRVRSCNVYQTQLF
ncbi:hypothetical protein BKA59DRAFT_165056 [Fusarium tricinctum]|uniref:Velvet domain-containing protein n=1 Tax=Fusarium tricinctum TaxID=61284 RepID=A0A8K0WEU8_9HYPO|nr:hypothetical protein BKA59DRAFT_165056 [Fusarium tricinctum]